MIMGQAGKSRAKADGYAHHPVRSAESSPDGSPAGAPGGSAPDHVAIIGGGSAAFACAIEAASRGSRVSIIERSPVVGGCCVNVGCIPSKQLIHAASLAASQRSHPVDGIDRVTPEIDARRLARERTALIETLRGEKYEAIIDGNENIELVHGEARLVEENDSGRRRSVPATPAIEIRGDNAEVRLLSPDRILIATGSRPAVPAIPGLAGTPYWTSTEALFSEMVPEHLIVIGSSVVAVELAQAWRRLGASVTVLARNRLLSRDEALLGKGLTAAFKREGIRVVTGVEVKSVSHRDSPRGLFTLDTSAGEISGDRLLVATGRTPNTEALRLETAGIGLDNDGAIFVDSWMQTSRAGVYAAGDCSNMPQHVYVAAAAGRRAAANMYGESQVLDLSTMPAVTFTDPQVATVGLTEEQARDGTGNSQTRALRGTAWRGPARVESRRLDLAQVPRARVNGRTDGFVKLVAAAQSGRILGAQILAPDAGEMIQSVALAMRGNLTVFDLGDGLCAYLTMNEAVKLAAQSFSSDLRTLSCCAG